MPQMTIYFWLQQLDIYETSERSHKSQSVFFTHPVTCLLHFVYQDLLFSDDVDFLSKISSVSGFPSSRGSLGFAEQRRNGVTQWIQWIFSICFSYPGPVFNVETRGTFGCLQNYNGTPKSSILIGFSIINHPFWGTPSFFKHPFPPVKKEGQTNMFRLDTPPPKVWHGIIQTKWQFTNSSEISLPMDSFLAAMINFGGKCLTLILLICPAEWWYLWLLLAASLHHLGPQKKIPEKSLEIMRTIWATKKELGGGNSNIFGIFAPIPGEMIQFDEHIFQMGWCNHQLEKLFLSIILVV